MAVEMNDTIDFDDKAAGKKGDGRIFAGADDSAPKVNLDEEIEKNIRIRTMPRKFKISSKAGDKKTTIVGAVIMIVGFLVLAAAVYLAYIFLINPKAPVSAPAVTAPKTVTQAPAATPSNPAPFNPPAATTTPPVVATSTPVAATSTQPVAVAAPVATTTNNIATSSQPVVATSTVPAVAAAPSSTASSILTTGVLPPGSSVLDSDHDNLSDAEEAIFGTDPNKADTDGDGYTDGAEVLSLYNPAGTGKIIDNKYIGVYNDANAKFSVDYPKIWQVQDLNSGLSIIFSAADNSFVEIIAMPDTGGMSIKDWYNSQFPDTPVTAADVIAKNGWQGVFHQSREIFYLANPSKSTIYTISYVPASDSNPQYYHIFLMMINSFSLK
jgi:Bacterial TSP3 repeat